MCTFFELGKAKGPKEEGRLRLSSAVPKIQWDSNPHCHYGYGKPLPFKYNKALLEMVELIKLKKLQKHYVMLYCLCRPPLTIRRPLPPPPPSSFRTQHYRIPLSKSFSWVGILLAHTAQTTSGTIKGIMEAH